MATPNYNFTELDPDGKIDIATDVNKALGEIDNSLKAVADAGGSQGSDINAKNGTESGSLILNNPLNTSSGQYATAAGSGTQATKFCAYAEGYQTTASGMYSHAEGFNNTVNTSAAHVEGEHNKIILSAVASHAEGSNNTVGGQYDHAEGYGNICKEDYCHVGGKAALEVLHGSNYLEVIGNGTSETERSNARTLKRDGTGWYAADVKCGGTDDAATYSLASIGAIVNSLPDIEFGVSNSLQVPANSNATADITFGSTKSEIPNVYCQVHSATRCSCSVEQVTNSQVSIKVYNDTNTDADAVIIDWLAISGR